MNKKIFGQVYTPEQIAEQVISMSGLNKNNIADKMIMENSCGEGIFIKILLEMGANPKNIYAIDIDQKAIDIVKEKFKDIPSENIICGSSFDNRDRFKNKFDFVIGNPPYVRIHNLDLNTRSYLQDNFNFCKKGMTDLYMAFFELGLEQLNENGTLSYITPNSFLTNISGKNMRDHIDNNKLLFNFKNFNNEKIFSSVSTYTAITVLKKNNKNPIKSPWFTDRKKIGLKCSNIQNGIATLKDKIFIQKKFHNIEDGLLRDIYKASSQSFLKCIYPYIDGILMSEEHIKENFPNGYKYLLSNKEELLKRSITGNTKWYEYGRSQGINNMDNEKIAISTFNPYGEVRYRRLPKDCIVYSGLYAIGNLDDFEVQLNSDNLIDYVTETGTIKNGNYVSTTSTVWKNY